MVRRSILRLTLPDGVPRNGRFNVSTLGTPLPPAITLSPEGSLHASANAESVSGVIFEYTHD